MTERTTIDSLLESMLEDRAGGGAPSDLRRQVVAAALAEVPTGRRRSRLAEGRHAGSPMRLLAIAAVLGTAAVGAVVAGGALLGDRTPPDRATVILPEVSPSVTRPTDAPRVIRCTRMPDNAYAVRDELPIPAYPFGTSSSDILYVAAPATGLELTRLEGTGAGFRPVPIPSGKLPDPVALGVSPDGRWVTIDAVGDGGTGCGDPVLVSVVDGSMLRPFAVGGAEAIGRPAWSADGRTLYAVYRTLSTGPLVPVAYRGSVWAWDRATNTVTDLGSPCDGCGVRAVFPRASGEGLIATYNDADTDSCGHIAGRACSSAWGIAVRDGSGWRVARTRQQLDDDVGSMERVPLGVASDGRFAIQAGDGIAFVPLGDSGSAGIFGRPCCYGLNSASISPDGSTIAGLVTSQDGRDTNVVLMDTASHAWFGGAVIGRNASPNLAETTAPIVLAWAWAPDGTSIGYLMTTSTGDATFLRIVREADGTVDEVPLAGPAAAALSWLPSTP